MTKLRWVRRDNQMPDIILQQQVKKYKGSGFTDGLPFELVWEDVPTETEDD